MGTEHLMGQTIVTRSELRAMQQELASGSSSDEVRERARRRLAAAGVPAAYMGVNPMPSCLARLEGGYGYWIAGAENGTGKTTRACAMVRTWVESHVSAQFVRCASITAFDRSRSGYEARWESTGLLVLDDLGKEVRSEHVIARLLNVIDARVASLRPIIVTSNLTLAGYRDALIDGGVRRDTASAIYSRLNGACEAVHMTGADRRDGMWRGAACEGGER